MGKEPGYVRLFLEDLCQLSEIKFCLKKVSERHKKCRFDERYFKKLKFNLLRGGGAGSRILLSLFNIRKAPD